MLTTATWVPARKASRSARVMARDMGVSPRARTYCSRWRAARPRCHAGSVPDQLDPLAAERRVDADEPAPGDACRSDDQAVHRIADGRQRTELDGLLHVERQHA